MKQNEIKFEGEEAQAGYASPRLDLIAAVFLIALSVIVMIASLRLPLPGGVYTAPGLLPFLTAASLLLMALMLGYTALQRRRSGVEDTTGENVGSEDRDTNQDIRSLLLALSVAIYIGALHYLAFQKPVVLAGLDFTLSAFEPVTIVALAAIIHMFWRGPLWVTVIVSVAWALVLSVVFQKAFLIPLPGGF